MIDFFIFLRISEAKTVSELRCLLSNLFGSSLVLLGFTLVRVWPVGEWSHSHDSRSPYLPRCLNEDVDNHRLKFWHLGRYGERES